MDPVKSYTDYRLGSRKSWEDLSSERKRKLRKLHFDSLDRKLLHHHRNLNSSNSTSNPNTACSDSLNDSQSNLISNCSDNLNNDETASIDAIESIQQNNILNSLISNNQIPENVTADDRCSSVSQITDNSISDVFDFALNYPLENNDINNLMSVTTSNEVENNSVPNFCDNSNINFKQNDNNYSSEINETSQIINKTIDESIKTYKPSETLSQEEHLKLNLSKCIVNHKINQVQANAILNVLRNYPLLKFLPKDCRSLLKTPRDEIDIKPVSPGEYMHLGLEVMLKSILNRVSIESIPSELLIDFSTDGAELNKETQMWPIQFRVVNLEYEKPELAGIYRGKHKPNSASDFFLDFVNEINSIKRKGGINYKNNIIPIKLRCFIADAPARSYILNHYGHNSEYPCSKCHIKGVTHIRSKRFPGINYELRTNKEYRLLTDVDHNKGKSAIHDLSLDLVQQVPFDYMHLVCLGVMKKLIESLVFGSCKPKKLENFKKKILSNRFTTLQLYCPREFARIPRELDQFSNFKATEFRQLLLYTFIVVFRGVISNDQYDHFLLLHSSMRVLLNCSSSPEHVDFAEEALKNFVLQAEDIHGLQFLTYNAHGVLHLVSDYKLYGPLDSISVFPYENQMPKFRDFVRKPNKPLQQIFRRIQEEFQFTDTKENNYKHFKARNSHNCGPIPGAIENFSMQYENLQTPSFFLSLQNTDNTIITHSGQIDLQPLYSISNRPSTDFGVFLCTSLNDSKAVIITYNEIQSKCYRMPLWINKPFLDINSNDEQLNNAYVAVVM